MNRHFYIAATLFLFLSAGIIPACVSALAADDTEKAAAAQTDAAAEKPADNAGRGTVLQGGVKGSAVKLEEGLNMIEGSSKLVEGSAFSMAQECTRKEQTVMRGPNYIGNGIVIPALGGNGSGIVSAGELPARKDKVEAFLGTAEDGLKALKTHVDGLIIPEGSPDELNKLWKDMQGHMQVAETNIASIKEIVEQIPSKKGEIKVKDAKPIGRAALKVYDSMTAMTKIRKQMDALVKPETK